MLLANVFTKTVRDRQVGTLISAVGIAMIAVLGLAAYSDLDDTIAELYSSLPEGFLAVLGLEVITDAGSLILGEIVNLMGPLVLAGLAISMGSAAVAGEERKGTFGVLLGNPRSRQQVVFSKAVAMIVLISAATALAGALSVGIAEAFETNTSQFTMTAAMVHVAAIALFFGFLALFIGSWTGNTGIASGVSAGYLLLSFLAAGLLPLVERLADVAKAFPWYYFNSSGPLQNGYDWGHLSVLVGATAVLWIGALVGVGRRDLKIGNPSGTLLDRARRYPIVAKTLDRLAGTVNVTSIAVKSTTDHRTMTTVAGAAILYTALLVGPMYNGLADVLVTLSNAIPDGLKAMIGFVDMGTPEGFYTAEVFSIVVPAALIAVGAALGGRALAGEEEDHTMDLLLANPIPRSRVVLEKAVSIAIVMAVLGLATFAGVWFGSLIGGLDMAVSGIAASSLLGTLLGWVFGSLALLLSAATGSRRATTLVVAGAGFLGYFANAFLPVNERLADWARLSPFYYYANGDPLANGLQWGNAAVLLMISVVLVAAAIPLFQRRDVRG